MSDELEQPTCGKGLAANASFPRQLGEVIAAMAEVLENHKSALDLDDANSKQEDEAYQSLVHQLREIAAGLAATAQEMEGYRDLPMGRHDEQAMAHPRAFEVFENYVRRKQELLAFLQTTLEEDQMMLDQMS